MSEGLAIGDVAMKDQRVSNEGQSMRRVKLGFTDLCDPATCSSTVSGMGMRKGGASSMGG